MVKKWTLSTHQSIHYDEEKKKKEKISLSIQSLYIHTIQASKLHHSILDHRGFHSHSKNTLFEVKTKQKMGIPKFFRWLRSERYPLINQSTMMKKKRKKKKSHYLYNLYIWDTLINHQSTMMKKKRKKKKISLSIQSLYLHTRNQSIKASPFNRRSSRVSLTQRTLLLK